MKPVILAFESSCDDSAVAIVDENGCVLGQKILSQTSVHNKFGGVVPELASRLHESAIDELTKSLISETGLSIKNIKKVAATCGPGLIGPLLVGKSYAEGLAAGWKIPFVGVHHLRGHVASVLLDRELEKSLVDKSTELFPAIVLLVSGGHTQLLKVDSKLRAKIILTSHDDAAGECFDKSAKLMGLPYPGGPAIENLANSTPKENLGVAELISQSLPRPKSEQGFSFAGLKTAIRTYLTKNPESANRPEFAWAVQESIGETLLMGLKRVEAELAEDPCPSFIFCGGVSANLSIRLKVTDWAKKMSFNPYIPSLKYCTDNAAMIAAAAWVQDISLNLVDVAPRIPLVDLE